MTVEPQVSMWINIVLAIAGALSAASSLLTPLFGEGNTHMIVAVCGLLVAVLGSVKTVLHASSSPQPGPLAK